MAEGRRATSVSSRTQAEGEQVAVVHSHQLPPTKHKVVKATIGRKRMVHAKMN